MVADISFDLMCTSKRKLIHSIYPVDKFRFLLTFKIFLSSLVECLFNVNVNLKMLISMQYPVFYKNNTRH